MLKLLIGVGVAALVAVSPPSQAGEIAYMPVVTRKARQPHGQDGIASWYGAQFEGSPTASGETYNMNAMTAAHRHLPLGTRIRVINLRNHRSLVLRINDRGPYIPGRFLDVSRAAARWLGFARRGKARVHIQILQLPERPIYRTVCPGSRLSIRR